MKPQSTLVTSSGNEETKEEVTQTDLSVSSNSLNASESNIDTTTNNEVESESETDFYFETDHVALRGNKDYLNILKTVAVLEAQRIRAVQDMDRLLEAQEEALQDPVQFIEKLQNGELDIPAPQVIAEIPSIDWSKYNVDLPAETRPQTRKTSSKPTFSNGETTGRSEEDPNKDKNQIFVRGRMFDDTKPETFNQTWTTEEQRRLEELLEQYPSEEVEAARWKKIAAALGNRTAKQVCSRVQKYFLKLQKAGLPIPGRVPKSQPTTVVKRPYHRHQKNNHFLFRQTTFFPCQDVPVYMSELDEDTIGSSPNCSVRSYETEVKEEIASDDDFMGLSEKVQDVAGLQQLQLLRRVLKEKEKEEHMPPLEHVGFKCDYCKEEPIVGSRWHCVDCGNEASIDFCTDCVVTQMESASPHPLSHQLVIIRRNENEKGVWDQDYLPHSFAATKGARNYNYLDPNFMPE